MEPIYIHKLPDGTIRRHAGEPVGEGDFILVEPHQTAQSLFVLDQGKDTSKSKSFVLGYLIAAALSAAATAVLLNIF